MYNLKFVGGNNNEDKAYICCIEDRKKYGEDMEVEASALHVMPDRCFIGASLDGKVLCRNADTCSRGCLEIKCLYSINGHITVSITPTEITDEHPDFFIKRAKDGFLHLPTNHAYYAQVQGGMALLDVQWYDFVVLSNVVIIID